jgi:hypothetical protein
MSNATLDKKAVAKPAGRSPLVPPDEKFWIRYSPHGEAPLSGAASLTLHFLVFGMLVIGIFLLGNLWPGASRSLPVETVVFGEAGGGGNPTGKGDGLGGQRPPQAEDATSGDQPGKDHPKPNPDERLALNPAVKVRATEDFDPETARYIIDGPEPMQKFALLDKNLQDALRRGTNENPGKGLGGDGRDGGKGTGTGKGTGPGAGEGKLNEREKRMLRWSMTFDTTSGHDYLAQLRGLGAILAIPVGPNHYKTAHDLNPPVKFSDEDLSKINRIWWIDENEKSVGDLGTAMGLSRPFPPRVIAFIPPELEKELADKEKDFKHLEEDQIFETKFRVEKSGGKYVVKVSDQKPK